MREAAAQLVQALTASLGLILLVSSIVFDAVLAIVVYRHNWRSATNRIFCLLSVAIMLWSATYVAYLPAFAPAVLWLTRLGIFFAAPLSTLFFLLAHTMPSDRLGLSRRELAVVVFATVFMMAFNISPYAFTDATFTNGAISPTPGIGFVPFAVLSTLFSGFAIYFLIAKLRRSAGEQRTQFRLVLIGISLMLFFVITTILVPIIAFQSGFFVSFIPVYAFLFLGMTAYAIVRHHLFNVRVVATEAFVVTIWIVLFARIFVSESPLERVVDLVVLVAMVLFGVLLIRTVLREVEQREKLEALTVELEAANEKLQELDRLKSEFVSLASHQLRAPLSVIRGYLSLVLEGSYGLLNPEAKKPLEGVMASAEQLIRLVRDLLNLTRIESGSLSYNFQSIAFDEIVGKAVRLFQKDAETRKLPLNYENAFLGPVMVNGDFEKLYEVVVNMLDNAVRYSAAGTIRVRLAPSSGGLILSVADQGIGIASDDIPRLFNKFIRTEEAKKFRTDGMGIGLYFAKKIVADHRGRVWAESPGIGKGSTFSVELPVVG
ncbi:hypothetical protein HY442_02415 [Candidatus Parcubacteria bacterium]|nr:hypothetical protein [Candidatus Parcubacteria bacterium]